MRLKGSLLLRVCWYWYGSRVISTENKLWIRRVCSDKIVSNLIIFFLLIPSLHCPLHLPSGFHHVSSYSILSHAWSWERLRHIQARKQRQSSYKIQIQFNLINKRTSRTLKMWEGNCSTGNETEKLIKSRQTYICTYVHRSM